MSPPDGISEPFWKRWWRDLQDLLNPPEPPDHDAGQSNPTTSPPTSSPEPHWTAHDAGAFLSDPSMWGGAAIGTGAGAIASQGTPAIHVIAGPGGSIVSSPAYIVDGAALHGSAALSSKVHLARVAGNAATVGTLVIPLGLVAYESYVEHGLNNGNFWHSWGMNASPVVGGWIGSAWVAPVVIGALGISATAVGPVLLVTVASGLGTAAAATFYASAADQASQALGNFLFPNHPVPQPAAAH